MKMGRGRTLKKPHMLFAGILLLAALVPTSAAETDWGTIRILATVLRGTNEVVKQVFTEMKDSVNQYGLQEIISTTNAMNSGKGMARAFDGGSSYVLVKSGSFTITAGAASGKTFPYLLKITDTSLNVKLLFYFDDVNASYDTGALLVLVPSWFDDAAYSGSSIEVYLCREGGAPSMKITVDQALIQHLPPSTYYCADIRALVQDKGSAIEVSAFGYYNSGDSYKGYYTLGFSAMKDAPNNSRAFQGALLSDVSPSNNGLAFVGALNGDRNYGLFNSNSGGFYVEDQSAADKAGYPSVAAIQAIYNGMVDNASYFNADGNLSTLSISLSSYPQ